MSVAMDFVKCLEYQMVKQEKEAHIKAEEERNKISKINKSNAIKKMFEEQKQKKMFCIYHLLVHFCSDTFIAKRKAQGK